MFAGKYIHSVSTADCNLGERYADLIKQQHFDQEQYKYPLFGNSISKILNIAIDIGGYIARVTD